MSNENKDRKLKHHEKPIWRKAFEASMQHTSIEGATRNAWKAVDAWNQANAFNESQPVDDRTDSPQNYFGYTEAWQALIDWFSTDEGTESLTIDNPHRLTELLDRFGAGNISINEFKNQLKELDSFV